MQQLYAFNRSEADVLKRLIRERRGRSTNRNFFDLEEPYLPPRRTFVVIPQDDIPAAELDGGQWKLSTAEAIVYRRNADLDTLNSQDPTNALVAASGDHVLTNFTDQQGAYVSKRVFNLTQSIISADEPYLAKEDQFGDLYIQMGPAGSPGAPGFLSITGRALTYGFRDGDTDVSVTPIIGHNGTDNMQVKLFPDMAGNSDPYTGSVFSVNPAPTDFTNDHWLTVTENGHYRVIATGYWAIASLGTSDAESSLRAAQHRHGYGAGLNTDYASPNALSLETYWQKMDFQIVKNQGLGSEASVNGATYQMVMYSVDAITIICCNVMYYFTRNGSDATIDLIWTKGAAYLSSITRCSHRDCHVTVDKMGDL